ncbi:MAG: TIGR00703 family protein [Aquificae bacterium]|nr:TIGR00703 family protein [Aquificota bacterium]
MDQRELRELIALNTLVFETLGNPPTEREFDFHALRRWGLDLLFGKKDGRDAFFVSDIGKRSSGDVYEEGGSRYEVLEVLSELPKGSRLVARVVSSEGSSFVVGSLIYGESSQEIFRIPAPSMLMAFFLRNRLFHLANCLRSVGILTEFVHSRGQEGKPLPYRALPNVARRFLQNAKKIERDAGFGRVALAFFGKNREGDHRFRVSWILPTIALFDIDIAERADKNIGAFK